MNKLDAIDLVVRISDLRVPAMSCWAFSLPSDLAELHPEMRSGGGKRDYAYVRAYTSFAKPFDLHTAFYIHRGEFAVYCFGSDVMPLGVELTVSGSRYVCRVADSMFQRFCKRH